MIFNNDDSDKVYDKDEANDVINNIDIKRVE